MIIKIISDEAAARRSRRAEGTENGRRKEAQMYGSGHRYIRYVILAAAAAACICGALGGQTQAVMNKAVQICLECCGIG